MKKIISALIASLITNMAVAETFQKTQPPPQVDVPALMNELVAAQKQALSQTPNEEQQLKLKFIQPDTSILLWGTYRILRFEDKTYGTVCYFTMTGQNIS